VEAGAGENWHDFVAWTLEQGWPGLENLALIPGMVGASAGAEHRRLRRRGAGPLRVAGCGRPDDRRSFHAGCGAVRLRLPRFGVQARQQRPNDLGLAGKRADPARALSLCPNPGSRCWAIWTWSASAQRPASTAPSPGRSSTGSVAIRRAKLPDPAVIGNAGSFFKNPTVTPEQCADIIARDPKVVHYPMPDGSIKLAAGWLIDACGWKGKRVGQAAVYEKQALVLVNRRWGHGRAR
jgi:UDP-N-acetylmuramate dehydrogenase